VTLLELTVVVAIIAILGVILLPVFARVSVDGRRDSLLDNMERVSIALGQYTGHIGVISSDETWSSGDVHVLTGDVTVNPGVTLTVDPGAIVKAKPYCDLFVQGTLRAVGTEASPIIFTAYADDVGGNTNSEEWPEPSPDVGDWGGIWFEDGSADYNPGTGAGCLMQNCTIRWGGKTSAASPYYCGQVNCADAVPRLRDCSFSGGTWGGIRMTEPTTPDIADCEVVNHWGGNGIRIDYATIDTSITWTDCGLPFIVRRELTVNQGVTLTVEPGAVVKFHYVPQQYSEIPALRVSGTLIAGSADSEMAWFTSWHDDSVGGDTNNDGPSTGAAEQWMGIVFDSVGPGSSMVNCGIACTGLDQEWAGATCAGGRLDVEGCVFRNNFVGVYFGGPQSFGQVRNTVFHSGTLADAWVADGSAPTIANSVMYGNQMWGIRVIEAANATITNCIVMTDQTPGSGAVGIDVSVPTLPPMQAYRDVYGNRGGNYVGIADQPPGSVAVGTEVSATSPPTIAYCDVYGNMGGNYVGMADQTGSNGNISQAPLFADAANGDFHLKSLCGRWAPAATAWVPDLSHSPCVDGGDPAAAYALEPAPNGGRLNMGAYGNTAEASRSPQWRLSLTEAACGSVLVDGTPHTLPWEGLFNNAATVQITPVPNEGWTLDRWSGDVPTASVHENPLNLVMDQDRTINTHFKRVRKTLTIGWAGAGTVLVNGTPETLPYSGAFLLNETVTVDAVPQPGWEFQAWSGDVPTANVADDPLSLTMDQDRTIDPHFRRERRQLTVNWAGAGTVSINGTPQTVPYTGMFPINSVVNIDALPGAGWQFQKWTGDVALASNTDDPLALTMDQDRTSASNGPVRAR